MLPMPNLDDQTFEQLTENAKKMIHKLNGQWTDENYHDPGITFIELFAWLAELQQFYMSRVTEGSYLKFLKLLGEKPQEAVCSMTDVVFSNVSGEFFIPRGTKLKAGALSFETSSALYALPAAVDRIIAVSDFEAYDYTSVNKNDGVAYYAFGKAAKKGSRLYIGFDRPLPPARPLTMRVDIYDDYPAGGGNGCRQGIVPSAAVSWKYYGSESGAPGDAGGWLPVTLLEDETMHMTYEGYIRYVIPAEMSPLKIHPANDKGRYWICCTLEEEGFESPPRIDGICINSVKALNKETHSEVMHFSGNGSGVQEFELDNYLALYGCVKVQVRDGKGNWRYCRPVDGPDREARGAEDAPAYLHKVVRRQNKAGIVFHQYFNSMVPPAGKDNIRVICYTKDFEYERFIGRSSGTPGQAFKIPAKTVLASSIRLQAGIRRPGTGEYMWQDWELVEDFDASGPSDRHFIYDRETGEVIFGNNENGAIPEADSAENICIIALEAGGGAAGNIHKDRIDGFQEAPGGFDGIQVLQTGEGTGGRDMETLEEARHRVRRAMKEQHRTVTNGDYEALAMGTPGLRIARAKAIPLYEPGMRDYPDRKAPGQVTVVVVPYSDQKKPMPSVGFMETVHRHLSKHRLLTTEIHVVPPEYIKITVHGTVITSSRLKPAAGDIVRLLNDLLHPLDREGGVKGWDFGKTVYKSDIYGAVSKLEGVEYVKELWINAEGKGIIQEDGGDIHIPPHGLVYSGDHEIEVISSTES